MPGNAVLRINAQPGLSFRRFARVVRAAFVFVAGRVSERTNRCLPAYFPEMRLRCVKRIYRHFMTVYKHFMLRAKDSCTQ